MKIIEAYLIVSTKFMSISLLSAVKPSIDGTPGSQTWCFRGAFQNFLGMKALINGVPVFCNSSNAFQKKQLER